MKSLGTSEILSLEGRNRVAPHDSQFFFMCMSSSGRKESGSLAVRQKRLPPMLAAQPFQEGYFGSGPKTPGRAPVNIEP